MLVDSDFPPSNDAGTSIVSRMPPRTITLLGFFAGAFGAIPAVLAGVALSVAWPLWLVAMLGSACTSCLGWLLLQRPR